MRRPALLGTTVLVMASGLSAGVLVAPTAVASGPRPLERTPVAGNQAGKSVELRALGTHHTDVFNKSAAEIVAHDPRTQQLFVVNAQSGQVDVLDGNDPTAPRRTTSLATAGLPAADGSVVDAGAVVNSVDVRDGLLAVAVEAADRVLPGWVAFFRTADLGFVSAVRVGSQPDMLVFTPDGRTVLVANEAEPAPDFSSDPEGSVSVVDVTGDVGALTQDAVRTARFTAFEGAALPAGVRVFGPDVAVPGGQAPAGPVARNLEPEYVTVEHDSRTAYVALQEANTIAVLDVASASFTRLLPLGTKDWSPAGGTAGFDASDRDGEVALRTWPVRGIYMPDSIASYRFRGQTFLVTANEGDAREAGSYSDVVRFGNSRYRPCPEVLEALGGSKPAGLQRLNVSLEDGFDAARQCFAQIHTLGGRSFSVFTTGGQLVFDSGSEFEQRIAAGAGGVPPVGFNANHTSNDSFDTRSDDKGPEPEGVATGQVAGRTYAFIGLERVGGVMTYDVTDPRAVRFVDYVNNRDWSAPVPSRQAGDLGTEGVTFVRAEDSPTGRPLVLTANEVSGTTTAFAVDDVRARPARP